MSPSSIKRSRLGGGVVLFGTLTLLVGSEVPLLLLSAAEQPKRARSATTDPIRIVMQAGFA
jgi:hypothetical protein